MAQAIYTNQQIIGQLDSGYHWSGTNLTYGFPTNASWFPYGEAAGFSALSAAQQASASLAIGLWDSLITPTISYTANGSAANIKYENTTSNIGYAHAYYPGSYAGAGSVWFNPGYNSGTNNLTPPTIGAWGWNAFVHETGHALGLNHPGAYNGGSPTYANDALYTHDSQQYTIMSYFTADNTGADWYASNGQWYYPQTPMRDDVMAIQAIYGADLTTRAGNTVYGFNSNITDNTASIFNFLNNPHPVLCIWDGAGTDTIDLSGYSSSSLIDLTPGAFSNADMMTSNISIAYNAWIENAVSGGGNDTLLGNSLANVLTGNAGDDVFTGGGGNDTINGGIGTDTVNFSGSFANYTVTWNSTLGAYVVADLRSGSPDGADTVSNVENYVFADGTRAASGFSQGGTTPPAYSISPLSASAAEAITARTFTVTRTGDTSAAGTVSYAVTGSGASPANATDFSGGVLPGGIVNFAAGASTATITVSVTNDTTVEPDEGFTVTLSAPTNGGVLGTATATGSILNDDAPPPVISIAAASASLAEGDAGSTAFTFTVTRTGDTSSAGSVNWSVAGSGTNQATAADFTGNALPTGIVNFAAGQANATVTVNVAGDTAVETDETFAITLSAPSGNATLGTATATGTILNEDTTFAIAALDASKSEGNSGSTAFTFTVTRSGNTSVAGSVGYAVAGSGANGANAADFTGGVLPSGNVSFAAGQTTATITVNVAGDTSVEANETFTVTLSSPVSGIGSASGTFATASTFIIPAKGKHIPVSGDDLPPPDKNLQPAASVSLATATAAGSILNDDATTLAIAATDAAKAEGNAGANAYTFTVTRSGDLSAAGTVAYAVTGSGANAADGADFVGGVLPAGTVSFAAGAASAVITINVNGDSTVEPDNGFTVTLSAPSNGATITTATAAGTILNDDATTLAIAATDASKAEGNAGANAYTFTVTRSGDLTAAGTVAYAVTGSGANAADGTDFVGGALPAGTVSFAAGAASAVITINVNGDATVEPDNGFTVTLSAPSNGATIATATAAGTILNDDTTAPTTVYTNGTTADDIINLGGSTQINVIDVSQGGNDTVISGSGNDTILLGASLTATDSVDGGTGNDTLVLQGGYTTKITFAASTMTNVDSIVLSAGSSYNLATNDANIGSGARLTVDASALASINTATVTAAAELDGNVTFLGGAGNDSFTGGNGNDILAGNSGADVLSGRGGADIFVYKAVGDSAFLTSGSNIVTSGADTIVSFVAGTDQIDLSAFGFTGAAASLLVRSTTGISNTTAIAGATGFFGTSGAAVEYSPSGSGRIYIDANKDGNLSAGDGMIQLFSVTNNSLTASSFKF